MMCSEWNETCPNLEKKVNVLSRTTESSPLKVSMTLEFYALDKMSSS